MKSIAKGKIKGSTDKIYAFEGFKNKTILITKMMFSFIVLIRKLWMNILCFYDDFIRKNAASE